MYRRRRRFQEPNPTSKMMVLEDLTLQVFARLPLKSIARFRALSKTWRSVIDSDYFRHRFVELHSSSSVSWSIIQMQPHNQTLEIIGHHGCRTRGLTRSPGSSMSFLAQKKLSFLACTDGLVLIYAEATDGTRRYYVGNPLSHEWYRIPLPCFLSLKDLERLQDEWCFSDSGLVTMMQSGVVVSYKVVWLHAIDYNGEDTIYSFAIYSSDTGTWGTRNVTCHLTKFLVISNKKSIALNGILHWLTKDKDLFIAYDFYGGHDGCSILEFPDTGELQQLSRFRRTITTSEGSIVYVNEFGENENRTLRVWKLVEYTGGPEAWQLFRKVSLVSLIELGTNYFPVVMHPLNSEIIYLWSVNKKGLILLNLRTKVFSLHQETKDVRQCMDGCILSFNQCSEYMQKYHVPGTGPNQLFFSQYVLPRWLHRLPLPQPA